MAKNGFVSRKELADECNISARTLSRRMKRHNIVITSGYISPEDQEKILKLLGNSRKNKL